MKLSLVLFQMILLTFVAEKATSDDPVEEWVMYYSGVADMSYDEPHSIAVDEDGNIYVAGRSYQGSSRDYIIIKYDTDGIEEWIALYDDGSGNDYLTSMALDSDGNIYVTGQSQGSGNEWDYATIKYSSDGLEQWVARYHGVSDNLDTPYSITTDDDGNVYVTGESDRYPYSGEDTNYDYCTIKYNCNGEEQWIRLYDIGQHTNERGRSITVGEDGSVYVTGSTYDLEQSENFTTIKYDCTGSVQWTIDYNSPGNGSDRPSLIIRDAEGYLYVGGSVYLNSGLDIDYAVVKYDDEGVEQWVAYYSAGDYSSLISMVLDDSGNVYVICSNLGYDDIQKYNSDGILEWSASSFDGSKNYICIDDSSNIYLTGSFNTGENCDLITSKYNSDGIEQWTVYFNGMGDMADTGLAIALDESRNIYVTGTSKSSSTWYDFVTIKYSQVTGIEESQWGVQPDVRVYPCPVNTYVSINITLLHGSDATLSVYGLDGRLVDTILEGRLQEGGNKFNWHTSDIPAGIYLLRFQTDSFESTARIVVVH